MRNMARRNMATCRLTMTLLIVKEQISIKGMEKFPFIQSTQEKRFINSDIPSP